MHHATSVAAQNSIVASQRIIGAHAEREEYIDRCFLKPGAPKLVFFAVTASPDVVIPKISLFPRSAEHGEVLSRLLVNLDVFHDDESSSPGYSSQRVTAPPSQSLDSVGERLDAAGADFELYFAGACLPKNSKVYTAVARGVVFVAQTAQEKRFAEENGLYKLEKTSNAVMWRSETGEWKVRALQ